MRNVVLALLVFLPASSAAALGVVPNPVPFSGGGMSGQTTLLAAITGLPAGGIVLDGSVGPTDTVLILQASLAPGSASALFVGSAVGTAGASLPDVPANGVGWIPGPDADISAGVVAGADAAVAVFLSGGTQADPFFVAYAGGLAGDGSLELWVAASDDLSAPAEATGIGTLVPEPGVALLLLAALAVLPGRRAR